MSPSQRRRFTLVSLLLCAVGLAVFFGLKAFNANIEYFLSPEQFAKQQYQQQQRYRLGGLVKQGSISTLGDGITRQFVVTDCEYDITVQFTGILPDLFRENQAIVATGTIDQNALFTADKVLAKHDENYIPSEAAEAVMKAKADKCIDANAVVSY